MADPLAQVLYRSTNAAFNAGGGGITEIITANPWQGFVDFSQLGVQFRIVIGGSSSSSPSSGTIRVRVGGTYGVVDGTEIFNQTFSVGTFTPFVMTQVITNSFTGTQLVKVTGQFDPFIIAPTWFFFPA